MTKVTQAQAAKVLAQVERRFSAWIDGDSYRPKLYKDWDGYDYVIIWEEGPYDWTLAFAGGDTTEEERAIWAEAEAEFGVDFHPRVAQTVPDTTVPGVEVEPYDGCVLILYR